MSAIFFRSQCVESSILFHVFQLCVSQHSQISAGGRRGEDCHEGMDQRMLPEEAPAAVAQVSTVKCCDNVVQYNIDIAYSSVKSLI